jgi:hypothetical protein
MIGIVDLIAPAAMTEQTTLLERWLAYQRRWLSRLGALFARNASVDTVSTRASIDAAPEEVWRRIMFYEEVPSPPPLLLRLLLPVPLRTSKTGLCIGAVVQCSYSGGGRLMKRITEVQPPTLVRFEVVEQQLGIERCFTTLAGSYEIARTDGGSEVALTTRYAGHLRPRWLWRTPERVLAHQLHRHILGGMSTQG